MNFMPGGHFFGALWFGLLFFAAVTSSLSMLQPAIAFLEDGFGLKRRSSVALLGVVTAAGALPILYFSRGAVALGMTDFSCNLMMIVAALAQVLIFGWVIGAKRGVQEMNRGSDIQVPPFVAAMIRYITPTFLIVILAGWTYNNLPGTLDGINPEVSGRVAARGVYAQAIAAHFESQGLDAETLTAKTAEILGAAGQSLNGASFPAWLRASDEAAEQARMTAAADAGIGRIVLIGVGLLLILLIVLSDIACRNRIGAVIKQAEANGEVGLLS
jgi:hypothetical protein